MLFQDEGLPEGNLGDMGSTGDGLDASEWIAVSNENNLPENSMQNLRMDGRDQNQYIMEGQMMDKQNGNGETEKKAKQNVTEIRKDMPVEQIYSLLTRDSAAAVVIPTKYYHGMTLGQLAIEKPQALEWYVTSYGGPDNLLRAAARFLLDTALKQAG